MTTSNAARTLAAALVVGLMLTLDACDTTVGDHQTLVSSGTGAHTLRFTVTPPGSRTLNVIFFCTSGSFRVVVRESPGIDMSGSCGHRHAYAVALPPVQTIHLDIAIQQDSIFTLRTGFVG